MNYISIQIYYFKLKNSVIVYFYFVSHILKQFIINEIIPIEHFHNKIYTFYYRTESTHLDETYFLRGRHNIKLGLDTYYFETDHNFNTSHDYKVAKIIANDLIEEYLENQLFKTAVNDSPKNPTKLNWTGNKSALTELIYALHSQGIFNNGNVDIKPIVTVFERTFNVDLGDFYHTFLELKSRKINRTKFLDELKESLIKKMDEQDGI